VSGWIAPNSNQDAPESILELSAGTSEERDNTRMLVISLPKKKGQVVNLSLLLVLVLLI
jgi:hypothetical protein